jgi:hypothetical protein
MGLNDWNNDPLDQDEVAEKIEEHTGVEPVLASNGPRFYAEKERSGEPRSGTLFAMVLPGPRLYVDPTAKNDVHGITPQVIREGGMFERVSDNWASSFAYSIMLEDEIPDEAMLAVEWSYERFLSVA